jgi:hypothetical protein
MLSYSSITLGTDFIGPTVLSAQAFQALNIQGSATLSSITAHTLTITGPLNFKQLQVKNKTEISGATSGENGEFNNLIIHGTFWGSKIQIENLEVDQETVLEDFKISGDTTIDAPLKAKNGSFNNINATETPIALYNVTVNSILVKNKKNKQDSIDNDNTKSNEVKLAGNTVVSGNITFESGDGLVFIRDKTAVLKGKIIGGKLKE